MKQLGDLLAGIPLPAAPAEAMSPEAGEVPPLGGCDHELVNVLAGGLPAGHLHVWGGPSGAGKTSFLLCLLHGAARHGRRVAYATYDLPASTLATRLLAMASGLPATALTGSQGPAPGVAPDLAPAGAARAGLSHLPFWFLEARGLGVASLEDRLVRMPFRADVLAVDYLQAVVREPGTDLGKALRDLSSLASRLHVGVVCALRAEAGAERPAGPETVASTIREAGGRADRVGWIAPATTSGMRRAEILENRYGERPTLPLRFDPTTGLLRGE